MGPTFPYISLVPFSLETCLNLSLRSVNKALRFITQCHCRCRNSQLFASSSSLLSPLSLLLNSYSLLSTLPNPILSSPFLPLLHQNAAVALPPPLLSISNGETLAVWTRPRGNWSRCLWRRLRLRLLGLTRGGQRGEIKAIYPKRISSLKLGSWIPPIRFLMCRLNWVAFGGFWVRGYDIWIGFRFNSSSNLIWYFFFFFFFM